MQSILVPKYICIEVERLQRHFIWIDHETSMGWHIVAWEILTQPNTLYAVSSTVGLI